MRRNKGISSQSLTDRRNIPDIVSIAKRQDSGATSKKTSPLQYSSSEENHGARGVATSGGITELGGGVVATSDGTTELGGGSKE